jgi:hypothetical protein
MEICTSEASAAPPSVLPSPHALAEVDRLGDEIAELAAHLDAATARLLDLIRGFASSTPAAAGTPASAPVRPG